MKKIFFAGLASGLFLLLLAGNSQAYIIVDTGEPTILTTASSLDHNQWLAARFNIDNLYTLTSIQVFLWSDNINSETNPSPSLITMAIYGDNGGLVDETNKLYSQDFYAMSDAYADWYGNTGLDWTILNVGSHWLGLEVNPDEYRGGWVHDAPIQSLIVAGAYGGTAHSGDGLYETNPHYRNIGLRIEGDLYIPPTPVPEPVTMLLFGTGLIGLVGFRKKFKK